jgi:hypothetical protein
VAGTVLGGLRVLMVADLPVKDPADGVELVRLVGRAGMASDRDQSDRDLRCGRPVDDACDLLVAQTPEGEDIGADAEVVVGMWVVVAGLFLYDGQLRQDAHRRRAGRSERQLEGAATSWVVTFRLLVGARDGWMPTIRHVGCAKDRRSACPKL